MMVTNEEKRWLVVGIAMNKVAAPVLRDFIKQGMDTHYANNTYCHGVTTPSALNTLTYHQVNADPNLKRLKFQNINNNQNNHGNQKSLYNYNVNSSVDLAKLFLPDYLAEFSGFDESLDMSAILRLLGYNNPGPIFLSPNPVMSIQSVADDVRENVRNKWGHCNVTDWTEVLFNDCFSMLETSVRSLGLTGALEKTTLNQLSDWQTRGCQLCMGHAVDKDLLSLVQQEVKGIIADLAGHDARLDAVKTKLEKDEVARREEIDKILARLVSMEKMLSEELLRRVEGVEQGLAETNIKVLVQGKRVKESLAAVGQGMAELQDSLTKTVEQLAHEIKSQRMKDVKPDSPTKQFLEWCLEELHEFYNTKSKVKITPWDPDNTVDIDEIYIQLSMLRDGRKPHETTKEKLEDYAEMFKGCGRHLNPKRILVYGRPGIGKSTFTQKIAVDWARGKKGILKRFDVLLLFKLRDVSDSQNFHTMLETAELLSADDPMAVDNLDKYVRKNQGKVLLVFDGYDEYNGGKSSPVNQIWRGSLLRGCCVVITTRRLKEEELNKDSHVQLQLNGFDSYKQIKEFVSKFLSDQKDVEELVEYLWKHKLWDMAQIPLLLLMLCLVWKEKDHKGLPTSGADLYARFMQTLFDHLHSKVSEEEFQSIDEYSAALSRLGELAFYALLENCVHFSLSKLPGDGVFKKFIDTGFLQTSKLSSSLPEEIVYFLHKSVQEFVAAKFIVQELMNKKNESATCLSKVDSFKKIEEMFEVLKFACELSTDATCAVLSHLQMIGDKEGLTAYDFSETPSVEDLSYGQKRFMSICRDCLFSCAASGRQGVFPFFLKCVNYVLILNDEQVSIAAREHILNSSSRCPSYLFFKGKKMADDEVHSLLADLNTSLVLCSGEVRSVKNYVNLPLDSFFLKKEGQQMLFCLTRVRNDDTYALPTELLTELTSTAVSPSQKLVDDHSKNQGSSGALVLTENILDQTGQHCLSMVREIVIDEPTSEELTVLKNVLPLIPQPRKIKIDGNILTSDDAELIESMVANIHFSDNLHSLKLVNINLTSTYVNEIASSLHQASNLHKLDLSWNPLYSSVSDLVKNLAHVTVLRLSNVNMGEEEATVLGASLACIIGLRKLDISFNALGHGIIELANHLHRVPSLTYLDLINTEMGGEEATAVFRCLPSITQLEILNLSRNPLGYGIIELAKHLKFVPGLIHLNLSNTQMGEEEVSALARALKDVPELGVLGLSRNPLGRGVSVLIQHLSILPQWLWLNLSGVEMTKSEAEKLCTARGRDAIVTDYYVREENGNRRLRTEAELQERGVAFADEREIKWEAESNDGGDDDEEEEKEEKDAFYV